MITVCIKGVDFDIEYDYQPEEAEVRYYSDGSGHPGCPESLDITNISHKGVCFMEFFEDDQGMIMDYVYEILNDMKGRGDR